LAGSKRRFPGDGGPENGEMREGGAGGRGGGAGGGTYAGSLFNASSSSSSTSGYNAGGGANAAALATTTTSTTSSSTTSSSSSAVTLRSIAGETWVDKTLDDWPKGDFRLFVGDLGNEVTDAILSESFRKYPSFQKARVVRDKKTQKG
jgi:hypothetical protein